MAQDRHTIDSTLFDDGLDQIVILKKPSNSAPVGQGKTIPERHVLRGGIGANDSGMFYCLKHIEPTEMRCPEVALRHTQWFQTHRVARDIACFACKFNHFCNKNVVKPRVFFGQEPVDLFGQRLCVAHCAHGGIGLNRDGAQIKKLGGIADGIDRVHQLAHNRIAGRQSKQGSLVFCDKTLQDTPRVGKFRIEQRAFLLFG